MLACVCLGTPHVDAFAPAAVRPLGASLSSLTRPAAAVSGTTMGLIPVPKLAKMGAVSKWGRRAQAVKRQLGGGSAAQEPGEVRKVPSRKGIFLLILTILFEVQRPPPTCPSTLLARSLKRCASACRLLSATKKAPFVSTG